MKRILFAAIPLLILGFFCSCQKDESGAAGGKYGTLVGCWIDEESYEEGIIDWYCEFTQSGLYKEYDLYPFYSDIFATYNDGVLSIPASHKWVEGLVGKYDIVDGYLVLSGDFGEKIKIISKDKFDLDGEIYLRVKKFSTK